MTDMPNVASLVREARQPSLVAARILVHHTRPWFVGLIAHGSAVKGGFIEGWSDIDLQLYLEPAAFVHANALALDVAVAIQRDLAEIDPSPFQFISCRPVDARNPGSAPPPVPGAYSILDGSLPVAEATARQLREDGRRALTALHVEPQFLSAGLLEHGGGRLPFTVRSYCNYVWLTLFHFLAATADDPLAVWSMTKPLAVEALPSGTARGDAIRVFYRSLLAFAAHGTVDAALAVISDGAAFLRAVEQHSDGLV